MNCLTCIYKKHIPLYSKCAGITGRNRVGTAYYCGHPEMMNPVPIIQEDDDGVLKECPFISSITDISKDMQDTNIS
ncbi:MAG: hypothetical protein QCH31_04980 [Methanolobus sp.]|nr:hypothetical protein [Methanolobus sp.]